MNSLQKVLVADDDAINREVLAELLKPEYTVLLAKDGTQALDRAARHVPDLVLLDVMMPDMDGFEVLRRLRDDPRTADIAVIFVSGMDRPEDEANGLKLGAADYISKPFNATVVMTRVATHLQLVRQRRMLERLADVDGLTELANRRRFDDVFGQACERARRDGAPLSLALLDIDSFKQYNDHYGHPAGDRALRAVARVAAGCAREGDLVARYGGAELALVMPGTDAAQARQVIDAMRAALERLAIEHVASPVAPVLTVSTGGATLGHGEDAAAFFAAADTHLYRAKQAGRNRMAWRA